MMIALMIGMTLGVAAASRIEVYDYTGNNTGYAREKVNYSLFDAQNFTGERIDITGNLTLGQKITFAFSEMIDNIVNGWIKITGSLNVTGETDINGNLNVDGTTTLVGNVTATNNITASFYFGDGRNLTLPFLDASPLKNLNDQFIVFSSTGKVTGGTIIDSGVSGQVNVSSGTGTIRNANDHNAPIFWFNWSELNNIVVPADSIRYIGVKYNSGSPIVDNRTTDNWNMHDEFPLGTVVFENNVMHIELNPQFIANFASHGLQRFYETFPLKRDDRNGGLIIGETGTREITVTSGTLWDRVTEFSISQIDTSDTDTFDCYHRDGSGGFTLISGETQWNNTHYDNNAATLTELTTNKHSNIFFYLETDGELVCVFGRVQHNTFAQALMEDVPNTLSL